MNPDNPNSHLEPAVIDWQDSAPLSVAFGDIYFSRDGGVAESRYVFLQQNDLPARWQAWDQPGSFTIGETGFGTGLNFFCVWELWRQMRKPDQHLHFISVEKFPLRKSDLERACSLRPEFTPFAQALLQQYPPMICGIHRLHFLADNLTLSLIFDDAITGFTRLDGKVDAWFLDGFAPARNPAMWQPELFAQIARLSHEGTTFATFTSAGTVKRGMRDAGFSVQKHVGHGRKRHILKGVLTLDRSVNQWPAAQHPWFQFEYRPVPPGKVAIIGAGLAGCCAARKLAQRGWEVTLLERDDRIANQASGNATGITYAKLSPHDSAQNRYYIGAYLYACRFIRQMFESASIPPGNDWQLNGVVQLAYDAKELQTQQILAASGMWPDDVARFMDAAAVSDLLGIQSPHGATLMMQGGWLNPATLCRTLIDHPRIQLHTNTVVSGLERQNEQWRLKELEQTFDVVVFANAFNATEFSFADHLPLRWVRGQVSHIPVTTLSQQLQHAINYDGYINPARNGYHCVGATFDPRDKDPAERVEDHQHNLDQLRSALPSLADTLALPDSTQLHGRVGFRCQTPDFLPLVGPLPDPATFDAVYADISKGNLKREFPRCPLLPGLFITTAFGAKGITGAPLAAEMLASYICGEPQPVDREVTFALHPARFLQRTLKRRGRQA